MKTKNEIKSEEINEITINFNLKFNFYNKCNKYNK